MVLFGQSVGTFGIRQFLCANSVHDAPIHTGASQDHETLLEPLGTVVGGEIEILRGSCLKVPRNDQLGAIQPLEPRVWRLSSHAGSYRCMRPCINEKAKKVSQKVSQETIKRDSADMKHRNDSRSRLVAEIGRGGRAVYLPGKQESERSRRWCDCQWPAV